MSHASKLKILQDRLQQYMNQEIEDVQVGFRKGKGTRDQIANIHWIIEKARELQKNVCFIDYTKAFWLWITTNSGKFLKRWEYQTLPASWETCMQVKNQQLEQDMKRWTDSNWEWSTWRLYIVTLLILLPCRVHHGKCRAEWITGWNQDFWEKYQQPQICRW